MYLVILRKNWQELYKSGPWPSKKNVILEFQNNLYAYSIESPHIVELQQSDNTHITKTKRWINALSTNTATIPKSGIEKLIKIGD